MGIKGMMGLGLTILRGSGEAGSVGRWQGREFFREIQSSGLAKVHGGEGEMQRGLGILWISDDAVWEPAGSSHTQSTRGSHWRNRG